MEADVLSGGEIVTVASAYVHTGEAGTARQAEKERFLGAVGDRLSEWGEQGRYAVVSGDLNVAHREDDLRNWKGNLRKAGFLPQERACFDRSVRRRAGWVDVHRRLPVPGPGPTRGGPGAAGPSTTTPAGGSTTRSPAPPGVAGGAGRGRAGGGICRCAGATTRP